MSLQPESGITFDSQRELRQAQMIRAAHPDARPGSMFYREVPPITRSKPSFLARIRYDWQTTPTNVQIMRAILLTLSAGATTALILAPK